MRQANRIFVGASSWVSERGAAERAAIKPPTTATNVIDAAKFLATSLIAIRQRCCVQDATNVGTNPSLLARLGRGNEQKPPVDRKFLARGAGGARQNVSQAAPDSADRCGLF
jgi:hypothetical protein